MKTALSRLISLILVFGIISSVFPTDTVLAAKSPRKIIPILKTPPTKPLIPEITQNGKIIPTEAFLATREGKEILEAFQREKNSIKPNREKVLNDAFKFTLTKKLIERGELPKDYLDKLAQGQIEPNSIEIDAKKATIIDPKRVKITEVVDFPARIIKVEEVKTRVALESLDSGTMSGNVLNYLISTQNPDGSWGNATSTRFITTAAVIDALQVNNITGTTTDKGVEWISYYFADNYDYLAEKTRILIKAGEATSTFETLLNGLDEVSGGFVFDRGYRADPLTSAKVLQALFEANYTDYGTNPDLTKANIINYLVSKKRLDNGWSVFDGGVSNIPVTTEVIEALLFSKGRNIGGVPLNNTIDPAINSLVASQNVNGSWGGAVLDTALAYYVIKSSGATPTFQLNTVDYFSSNQSGNGSFDDDIYKTAKVYKALSVSTDTGQLLVTNIFPNTTLQTGFLPAEIKITVSNPGNTAVSSGKLNIFADSYFLQSFDFQTSGIVVPAGGTINITVLLGSTRNHLGNVNFKVFIEGTNGVIHPNSLFNKSLTFLSDPANRPGLPEYFVAYKNVSSSNGTPAISWKWPVKFDPNLKNIVLMFRVAGTTTWSQANITGTTTTSGATVGNLVNEQNYEATLGTASQAGQIYLYNNYVPIRTSSSASSYVSGTVIGKVRSLDGNVPNIPLAGIVASTNATSTENGDYIQNNIPWGAGYARVSDFRYEAYTNDYRNLNNGTTTIDVYTNRKLDTQIPTVSNISIIGESDKVFENKKTKLIQYSINDDIGTGGNGIVSSATFYYFDPSNSTWNLIGSDSGFLSGTRTFNWYIPGNLVGNGYKIKVVARDFSGKDSLPSEWGGTFQILAGNAAPEFTFVEPGSATSTANLNFLIKWTDRDDDSNATTTLSYDIDNNPNNSNHNFITNVLEDDPLNQFEWNTSQIATTTVYIRADSSDGANATTTVYSTGTVYINHPTAPDTVPPTVKINYITADNFTVTADSRYIMGPIIKVNATTTDNIGITSVKFYLKNATTTTPRILINEDFTSPYQSSITTALYPNGKYFIEAVARDTSGNTATSTLTDYPLTFDN